MSINKIYIHVSFKCAYSKCLLINGIEITKSFLNKIYIFKFKIGILKPLSNILEIK